MTRLALRWPTRRKASPRLCLTLGINLCFLCCANPKLFELSPLTESLFVGCSNLGQESCSLGLVAGPDSAHQDLASTVPSPVMC